jgi:plastocyanin
VTRTALLSRSLLVVSFVTLGCSDGGGNGNPGIGGSGGGAGATGTGGGGSSGGGAGGGTPGFMSIAPCQAESSYTTGVTTVDFGVLGTPPTATYAPKCLKTSAGTTVAFSGDFDMHPLVPSALRGTTSGNPITETTSVPDGGTSKSFLFSTPGFFAYFCRTHNPSDNGAAMSGVVWVQ